MNERPAGWATAAGLALDYADRIVLRAVRDVHNSISDRAHGVVDLAAHHRTVPHLVHEGIAEAVFASIGLGLRNGSRALHKVDQVRAVGPPMEASPFGRQMVSALHGVIGDQLAERAPAMAIEMAIRSHGHDVLPTPADLSIAFPDAKDSLVVFLHGLCESETVWWRKARPRRGEHRAEPGSYGDRLSLHGWTPLYLRINSGLPVAESGVALQALLNRTVENWPVPVRRIVLVGHSMGGLIARSAMSVQGESAWTGLVSDVVTLGTPHLGSPVERGIARGMRLSSTIPEFAPYSRIFGERSSGVLDLSRGLPDDPAPLPGVRYRLVAGSTTQSSTHPFALALGDGLVQPASAFGERRSRGELFPGASKLHVPNAHHFDILNHDEVYAALEEWLGSGETSVQQLEG